MAIRDQNEEGIETSNASFLTMDEEKVSSITSKGHPVKYDEIKIHIWDCSAVSAMMHTGPQN